MKKLTPEERIATQALREQRAKDAKKRYVLNHPEKRRDSFNNYWKKKKSEDPELWKEQQREKAKGHRLNHLDEYQKMEKEKSRLRRLNRLEEVKKQHRGYLLAKYGLNHDSYKQMVEQQLGKCAICKGEPTAKGLQIDHCHKSSEVRGLLCNGCNLMLGYVEKALDKNSKALDTIAEYLKSRSTK